VTQLPVTHIESFSKVLIKLALISRLTTKGVTMNKENNPHPLQAEYDAWLKDNIPADWLKNPKQDLSAENIMAYINAENDEFSITQAQYDWLADFCKRWDAIENS
tara:strand:+ start:59 stop:373 length:315 start_codon:yes stop_codon:yes gene_type:complete